MRYEVRDHDDDDDEAVAVLAASPRRAAELYCENRDRNNVEFPPASTVVVKSATGQTDVFVVVLECCPVYHASHVKGA
jgi:hypothetical protein